MATASGLWRDQNSRFALSCGSMSMSTLSGVKEACAALRRPWVSGEAMLPQMITWEATVRYVLITCKKKEIGWQDELEGEQKHLSVIC